jgi:hypothetical protein
MQEARKKRNEKTITDNNPFDDFIFWLAIAAIDFSFLENEKQADCESDKEVEKK